MSQVGTNYSASSANSQTVSDLHRQVLAMQRAGESTQPGTAAWDVLVEDATRLDRDMIAARSQSLTELRLKLELLAESMEFEEDEACGLIDYQLAMVRSLIDDARHLETGQAA